MNSRQKIIVSTLILFLVACTASKKSEDSSSTASTTSSTSGSTSTSSTTGGGGISCPTGYVVVPLLAGYTSTDFCVAKYEMKDVSGVATSTAAGTPWVNITRADAITACTNLGTGYDLITNDEWQTMARNIEGVAANWATGTVGNVGGLSKGNSVTADNNLAASSDDNDSCSGTGATCDLTTWHIERRVLTLSNGSRVWDASGNVWDRVKDSILTSHGSGDGYMSAVTNSAPYQSNTKDLFGPSGDYTAQSSAPNAGLGYSFLANPTGMLSRGGRTGGDRSGIFATDLESDVGTSNRVGFRCVYHP